MESAGVVMTANNVAVVGLVLLAACPRQMNYAYQETLPASAFADGEPAEPAGREARQLLASARTVAFYPPDYCINIGADTEQVARYRTLRANCGVLLSSLERAAEKAGYEVVSWQNLRGTQRPIDYAREAKVDVLFEINEFDFGAADDAKLPRELAYTKWQTDRPYSPFEPSQTIRDRCTTYAAARHKTMTVGKVGTVDIKTVSVVDGRNRWRYRKNLTRARGVTYPRYAFGSHSQINPAGPLLVTLGGIGIAVGSGLALAQELSTDDPTTDTDERIALGSLPLYVIVASAALLAGGVAVAATTTRAAGAEESSLCVDTAVPTIKPGSSHDVDEEAENAALRSEMIGEFVSVIADVRATTPITAPQPVVPPAEPPAAPAPGAP